MTGIAIQNFKRGCYRYLEERKGQPEQGSLAPVSPKGSGGHPEKMGDKAPGGGMPFPCPFKTSDNKS